MSTWLQNIQWNDSAVSGMTEAPTTRAPTTAPPPPPPPPPPTNPNYPTTRGYGDGSVVFPLPVSPDLLLGSGSLDALNPITTTPAPTLPLETLSPTLPPIPEMMPGVMPVEEEKKPFWTLTTVSIAVVIVLVAIALIYFFSNVNKPNTASSRAANAMSGNTRNRVPNAPKNVPNTPNTPNTGNAKNTGNKGKNTFNDLFKNLDFESNKPARS